MRISSLTILAGLGLSAAGAFAASSPKASPGGNRAEVSPQALVSNLYRLRSKKGDPLRNPTDVKSLGRYFTARLARLYVQDQVDARGEVGRMDSDPLYYAQDFQITDFQVGEPAPSNEGSVVVVKFKNIGKPCRVEFHLVRTKAGWRISDIVYEDGNTLRRILESKFP